MGILWGAAELTFLHHLPQSLPVTSNRKCSRNNAPARSFPKFVSEDAAMHDELRKPGTLASFTINGELRTLELDARQSLLDVLREVLDLTGTKKGCNQGA